MRFSEEYKTSNHNLLLSVQFMINNNCYLSCTDQRVHILHVLYLTYSYKGFSCTGPSILSTLIPHLLCEAERAEALRVLVMNTNERVTEMEQPCSPRSIEC